MNIIDGYRSTINRPDTRPLLLVPTAAAIRATPWHWFCSLICLDFVCAYLFIIHFLIFSLNIRSFFGTFPITIPDQGSLVANRLCFMAIFRFHVNLVCILIFQYVDGRIRMEKKKKKKTLVVYSKLNAGKHFVCPFTVFRQSWTGMTFCLPQLLTWTDWICCFFAFGLPPRPFCWFFALLIWLSLA